MARSVATGFCRLTVVASRTRADVALPDSVPLAELLPDLLRMVSEPVGADSVGWQLTRLGEPPLPAGATLAESGVLEGEILYLVSTRAAPPPPVVEDLVDTVGDVLGAGVPVWTSAASRRLLIGAGATAAAAGAVLLCLDGVPAFRPVIVALAVGAALLVAATALRLTVGTASVSLALASVPYWAVAALGLAPRGAAGLGPGQWAFAALGAAVAAVLALSCAPAAAGPAAAVAAAALTVAVAGAFMARYSLRFAEVAAVAAPAWLAVVASLPSLVARITGVASVGLRNATSAAQAAAVRNTALAAHRLLSWLLAAAAAVVVGSAALLAADGAAARWLAAAVGVAAALRARSVRALGEVLPLALGALGCLLAVEVTAAARAGAGHRHGELLAIVLGTAAALLAAATVLPRAAGAGAALERALDRLETLVALALVPLLLGVLGVYGFATEAARRMH